MLVVFVLVGGVEEFDSCLTSKSLSNDTLLRKLLKKLCDSEFVAES